RPPRVRPGQGAGAQLAAGLAAAVCCNRVVMAARRAGIAALVLGLAMALTGCGSASPAGEGATASASQQSPVQAALSWFSAINHKDRAGAVADFEPSAAGAMSWGGGDTSTWPAFSALRCRSTGAADTTASVRCTFSESRAAAVGNPDKFWTIDLQRLPGGPWLIANYGQP
ncbi:MAG: hypothetical protein ACRDYD_03470, partial [Acidimicrobiales bacterium]